MLFKLTDISVILFVTTLINSFTTAISWQRRKTKGGVYFAIGMTGIALWTLAAGLDYAAIPIPLKVFFSKLEYTGYNIALSLLAIFSLFYAGYDNLWKNKWAKTFFALPFISILLAWTNPLHGWLWSGFTRSEIGDNSVIFEHGPGFVWVVIFGYLMIVVIVANLWQASRQGSEIARRQARWLLFATLIPVMSNLVYLFHDQTASGIDWTSLTFSISGLIFVLVLYGARFLDIAPIARHTIFERMGDGVLVLDNDNNVVDFNPAAQKFFRLKLDHQGSPIQAVMASWPEVAKFAFSNADTRAQINIIDTESVRVYNAQINLLKDDREQVYGKLITFRDITEQYQAQKELIENENLMRTIAKNYPNSYLSIIEKDFSIGFTSGNEYKKQNLEPGQFIGMQFEEFFNNQTIVIKEYCEKTFNSEEQEFELYINGQHQLFRTVPLFSEDGSIPRILVVVENITTRRQTERLNLFRLELWEYSTSHSLSDLMQKALDEICALTDSPIGFYHFVEEDQKTLSLQAWSTGTLEEFCRAEGDGLHYPIDEAGVWVDAFHQRKPVIHNNYAALPHRKGLPEGHAQVTRQLVVPVLHDGQVVSILGVGNKPSDYDQADVILVSTTADLVWMIVNHKLSAEKLLKTQEQLTEQQSDLAKVEERQRLARNLHDSVNQSIHSMVMFSDTLAATLEKKNFERADHIIGRLQESARQSLKETRLLLYELQAEGPGRSVDVVQELEERLAMVERRAGLRTQFTHEGSSEYYPPEWSENLFWIAIEALNNSLKHAQARSVQVMLRCLPEYVELEVRDDGIGFEPGKVSVGGMGLANLRARADIMGGNLTIESVPGKGTSIRFHTDPKGFASFGDEEVAQ